MATKLICDRCGAEIKPMSSVTRAGMRRHKTNYVRGLVERGMTMIKPCYGKCDRCVRK